MISRTPLPVLVPFASVERGELLHLAFGERKIPHGEVLRDVRGIPAPRNGDIARLNVPPCDDLRRRFSVGFCDFQNGLVLQVVFGVSATAEGVIAFDENALPCRPVAQGVVLIEKMIFILHHGGRNVEVRDEAADRLLRVEVRDAD